MRLLRVHLKDLGRFRGERTIDFSAIPDGLVCFVGPNGAGKTTLLEATAPAALFREFPTRLPGGFLDLVNSRDAVLEVEFETGAGDQVRLTLRGDKGTAKGKGKQECYVHKNGVLVGDTEGGKTGPYDAWIRENIVSRAMFYSNWFAVQKPGMLNGVGQFQTLGKADRSALFTEMLGIGHLQAMAKTAGDGVALLAPLVNRFSEALDSSQARMEEAGRLTDELSGARMGLEDATARLRDAKATLSDAIQQRDALREQNAAESARAAAVREKRDRLAGREVDLEAVENDLVQIGTALESADDLRAAAKEVKALDARRADLRVEYQRENGVLERLKDQRTAARSQVNIQTERVRESKTTAAAGVAAAKRLADEFGDLPELEVLKAAVQEAEVFLVSKQEAEEAALTAKHAAAETQRDLEAAVGRLEAAELDSKTLGEVPCEGKDDFASCQFLVRAGEAAESLPAIEVEVDRLKAELEAFGAADDVHRDSVSSRTEAKRILTEKRASLEDRNGKQRQIDDLQRKVDQAAEKSDALTEAQAKLAEVEEARVEVEAAVPGQDDKLAGILTSGQGIAADLEEAKKRATGADKLGGLEVRKEEKESRTAELRAEIDGLRTELAEAPDPGTDIADDLSMAEHASVEAQGAVDTADGEARDYQTTIDRKEAVLATFGDLDAKRAGLQDRSQRLSTEIGVWATLAQALGRNGIQILEIDAAGPRVAEVANQLLAETLGTRFRIEIITAKLRRSTKAGEDPYKDVFSIDVLDGKLGIRQDIRNTSGGEEVFIADALREALTIVANERRTDPILTLWGDEPTGALHRDNAARYVERKRAAMRIGGIRHMVMVSHQREIWEHADWIIAFDDDGAIDSMPTAEAIKRRVA